MTARHFIMTHLFSLIMARLVRGGRLPYSSFVHTLSVNRAFFLPTRVQETRRLIYSKIPRDGAPSSTGTREQRRLSLLTTSSASFQQGDCVETVIKGENIQGIVKQVRGSGWYAIQVLSSGDVIKVRGKQLSLVPPKSTAANVSTAADRNTVQSKNEASTCVVPPPTIIDLDAALESCKQSSFDPITNKRDLLYLQQCQHHASFKWWIMFTDLHCAPSTIETCLQVLQRVHAEAVARNAGVLFLGDFWHHRATIRVDLLNNVLQELSSWQVPLIMIPGNHDQVTLGGHNHGLTPLENSFRIDLDNNESNTSVNGPLIFSHPTKFMNALFIPHIRDNTIMESVLSSSAAENATALFVHADVTGAYMNDLILSQGGVSPLCFPPNKPIYSGHFHKPHVVTRKDVSIDYIGSPYETSLAEARQAKSLVVLDASQDWKMIERISLDIGRKHYHATSVEDLLALDRVKEGDRVVVTMAKDDFEQERRQAEPGSVSTIDGKIKSLRNAGATVEVRELSPLAMGPLVQSNEAVEEMTPQNILAAFLSEEVRREAMKNSTAEELLKAGLSLLEELELLEDSNNAVYSSGNMTNLMLESVSLQGFGSFKDQVTYPLRERGLVLVRGTNKDGGGDSNGSGKSSLAMSTLWALTGTLDPRPMQDAKVSDVVNDESKSARVTVRGFLNEKPFVITRTKTSTKGSLIFHLDGKDLTTQAIKDTQAIIDENLGVGPQILARTMFHGQFAVNGLLEATDAKLKEELSLVVPLNIWQEGVSIARANSREASKKSSEFEGMVRLRSSDFDDLVKRRDNAEAKRSIQQVAFERTEARIKDEIRQLRESIHGAHDISIDSVQFALDETTSMIQVLESQLKNVKAERDSALAELKAYTNEAEKDVCLKRHEAHSKQREYDVAVMKLESANTSREQIAKKWNIDLVSDAMVDSLLPELCPTCQQPISSTGSGHSHAEMQRIVKEEIDGIVVNLVAAEDSVNEAADAWESASATLAMAETRMKESITNFEQSSSKWTKTIGSVEAALTKARSKQAELSSQLTTVAKAIHQESIIKSKETTLLDARKTLETSQAVYQDLCTLVEDSDSRLRELRASAEAQRSLSVTMANLVNIFGPRGVQTFLLQNAIESLQTISQVYLDQLSDCSQRLELKLDASDRISRRAMIRGPNGDFIERPLSSLSGGQWRRCSLALSLGFADLVAKRGRMKTSLCVLDEPLTHLDRSGRSRVGVLLRSLLQNDDSPVLLHGGMELSTILIILQDLAAEELEESFDHIDEVVKIDGVSAVSIDEQS